MDKRVGFGPRLLAALLDGIVVAVVGLVMGLVVGGTVGGMLGGGVGGALGGSTVESAAADAAIGAALGAMAAFVGFVFLYSLIEAFTGASPGKMVLKLKVGFEDGRPAPVSIYGARWAVKYAGTLLGLLASLTGVHLLGTLASLATVVVFVGGFLVLGDKRQALHDIAAKTAVFRTSDLTA